MEAATRATAAVMWRLLETEICTNDDNSNKFGFKRRIAWVAI